MGRTSDARERLLHSAEELIHERGFNAVGVSEICSRAEVNKGSFYHFFPSKQRLALEVIEGIWQTNRGVLEDALLCEGPPLVRLRSFLGGLYENHLQCCANNGKQMGCLLANLGLEMGAQDPLIRTRVLQAFEAQIGYFESLLREAQKRGELGPDLDSRSAAETIFALIEGKIMLSKLRDDPETLHDLPRVVFAALGLATDT